MPSDAQDHKGEGEPTECPECGAVREESESLGSEWVSGLRAGPRSVYLYRTLKDDLWLYKNCRATLGVRLRAPSDAHGPAGVVVPFAVVRFSPSSRSGSLQPPSRSRPSAPVVADSSPSVGVAVTARFRVASASTSGTPDAETSGEAVRSARPQRPTADAGLSGEGRSVPGAVRPVTGRSRAPRRVTQKPRRVRVRSPRADTGQASRGPSADAERGGHSNSAGRQAKCRLRLSAT